MWYVRIVALKLFLLSGDARLTALDAPIRFGHFVEEVPNTHRYELEKATVKSLTV